MYDAPGTFAVDPDELARALDSLDDVALALEHAQVRLHELTSTCPGWAADGDLRGAVQRLADTLDEGARRGAHEALHLAADLRVAASRYRDAERCADAADRRGARDAREGV